MSSKTDKNKLSYAIILSIVGHVVLFGLLILGSMTQDITMSGGGGGEAIDAIMVNPNALDYQRTRQAKLNKAAEQAVQQQNVLQQQSEILTKQANEVEKLKQIEKERLIAQEKIKQIQEQKRLAEEEALKAQAEAKKQAQLAEEAKKKAEEEVKRQAALALKAQEEAKKKAEEEAKKQAELKAQAEAKKKAEEAKKQAELKAQADAKKRAAQQQEASNIIDNLASSSSSPGGSGNTAVSGSGGIDAYNALVAGVIQRKLHNCPLYLNKTCELQIKISKEGKLLDVQSKGGDASLCQAAIIATRSAKLPPPPEADYDKVKVMNLYFDLNSCF